MKLNCPIPITQYSNILLAHGSGGTMMHQLIDKVFVAAFGSPELRAGHDGAVLDVTAHIAMTTDSYVVNPLFFPGGDIGKLAVYGTCNDLAMCGARPAYLSAGFILEEGLPMDDLWRIVCSMRQAADEAGVRIVTGDTKVVERGKADGVFINTAGVGFVPAGRVIGPQAVAEGDSIIVNGDIGRHGIAVMAGREGLSFETTIESDAALLAGLVNEVLDAGVNVHCLRDLTRGGLAGAVVEIAQSAGVGILLNESEIPVSEPVRGACELLGFDPLHVANEGRCIFYVPGHEAGNCLKVIKHHRLGKDARVIGRVTSRQSPGCVRLNTVVGTVRIVEMIAGQQLPRIC
jgi:hydrogenase expression/formation protein HypE